MAQFNPGPNPITGTVNTAQMLPSGTGTLSSTGNLSVSGSGNSAVAVTVTGSSTLDNFGTIQQTEAARAIRLNTAGVTLTLNNGSNANSTALIHSAGDDAFQVTAAATNAVVVVNNYGTVNSSVARAINWRDLLGTSTINTSDPKEAAVVDTIAPGQYTVQVRGNPESTGIGVVQVYFLE